jgi:predicted amidohydrolase
MTCRIALVQPIANPIAKDDRDLIEAVNFVARAKNAGADFVCMPERYPGPWRVPGVFDPTPRLAEAAAKHGVTAIYGTITQASPDDATVQSLVCIAFGDGRAPVSYRGTSKESPVFDTVHGKIGLVTASEAYMPGITRGLARRGAELIFIPTGTDKGRLWQDWRNLIQTRANENLAIVTTTQVLFSPTDRGLAMVAAPGEVLLENTAAGLFFADVSVARMCELRAGGNAEASSRPGTTIL